MGNFYMQKKGGIYFFGGYFQINGEIKLGVFVRLVFEIILVVVVDIGSLLERN